ncbi:hypothetical protein NLG97_g2965 [Lecanicillium saksenae]|uniref:Uncharacterized protein n=1 Tax=Lecanicillium saksenae TaxID=468837 RepID=A0ACC1QZL5_9HYPO|nr:hypothetical protein NLG97_g2965 [Lecanicillium saksenae]
MVSVASPLSIIVESKTSSTGSWDSDKMHPSPLASHPFRIPTPSFSDLDIPSELQYSSRPMSALNVAGTRTSYLGGDLHDTVRHGENGRRRRSRDDVAALIEFLRTHEPPPDNFMSQPYSAEEDEDRGRWEKLKVMGKKRSKSMSRAPAPIRLPDSAVAGVTTGGHRHIAISIPLDASHFGDTPKSQYPVFNQDVHPPVPPLPESVRTFKNDKGVVTVLRPLSPTSHSSSVPPSPASPRRFDRDYPPQLLRNRRLMSSSPPPPSPADSEQWPLSRTESEASSDAPSSAVACEPEEEARSVTKAPPQTSEFIRAAYPTRGSSMAATPRIQHHHTSSIDEVIAEEEPYNRNPSPMPREGVTRRNTERRLNRPPVSLATSPVARKSTSNLRSEWQADKEVAARQSRVTQIADSPVINRDESPSPPASIISVKSRREKVRDKKLRDLAAARGSKLGNKASHSQLKGDAPTPTSKAKSAPADNSASSGPKLTGIMVVVDMKPGSEETNEELSAAATANDDDTESVIEMLPEPVMKLPTPPTSTETSPAQKHGFDTRTSLTRRREWQTSRAQERQKREANAVAKAQLRQLAASGTYAAGLDASSDPEREIFRLYEAYREQRLHDMETRVRRLEKNGDVWLRALIPMLEDVNNNSKLAGAGSNNSRRPSLKDDESTRDWASDDETAAANVDRLQRASAKRKLIRRASLSRERMLEELMRREERDMLDDYDEQQRAKADASGMGSIEPLMRELAGGLPKTTATTATTTSNTATPRARPPRTARKLSDDAPPIPLRARPMAL